MKRDQTVGNMEKVSNLASTNSENTIDESSPDYYALNGYAIFRNLIPSDKIEALLGLYSKKILPSKKHFFRQSSNRWETNRINAYGYAQESFRDIHYYPRHSDFSAAALDIFCSPEMKGALKKITKFESHNVVQSMLFDQNTETQAHQDSYYLDSLPNKSLVAAWIAMEDIRVEAGRFWVMPGTQTTDFELTEEEKSSNGAYLKRIKAFVDKNGEKVRAPALKKGDVLFWNSWTVHGSGPTGDERYSRKSLTAHYLPSHLQFGSRHVQTPFAIEYFDFKGTKVRKVPAEHSVYSLKNHAYTEVMQYLWYHPKIFKLAKGIWQIKKRIF